MNSIPLETQAIIVTLSNSPMMPPENQPQTRNSPMLNHLLLALATLLFIGFAFVANIMAQDTLMMLDTLYNSMNSVQ